MSVCYCTLAGTQACIACPNRWVENPSPDFKLVHITLIEAEKEDAE